MSKPYYIDEQCDTAREFIDFLIDNRRFSTRTIYDAVTVGINNVIFRGQANQDWPLLPNAFRKGNPLLHFSPQTTGGAIKDNQNEVQYLGWQLKSELRAVFLFLEHADKAGIPTPIDFTNLLEHNALILAALNNDPGMDYSALFPAPSLLKALRRFKWVTGITC